MEGARSAPAHLCPRREGGATISRWNVGRMPLGTDLSETVKWLRLLRGLLGAIDSQMDINHPTSRLSSSVVVDDGVECSVALSSKSIEEEYSKSQFSSALIMLMC